MGGGDFYVRRLLRCHLLKKLVSILRQKVLIRKGHSRINKFTFKNYIISHSNWWTSFLAKDRQLKRVLNVSTSKQMIHISSLVKVSNEQREL